MGLYSRHTWEKTRTHTRTPPWLGEAGSPQPHEPSTGLRKVVPGDP